MLEAPVKIGVSGPGPSDLMTWIHLNFFSYVLFMGHAHQRFRLSLCFFSVYFELSIQIMLINIETNACSTRYKAQIPMVKTKHVGLFYSN